MAPETPPGRAPDVPRRSGGWLLPAVLALALSAALLGAQRRLDLTLNEEGFLWYGAVAVAHGDVPLRDFYSYDPGRYYWAAAWTPLAGQGLLGLRLATAAFGALGLFCGLLAARRAVGHPVLLALLGIALTLWLLPRHKLYEPAVQMGGVLAATALVEHPTRRRHLAAGALTGFGLFMGKNHGLYLGVAFLALILLLAWRGAGGTGDASGTRARLAARLGAWLGGILLGAAPLAVMLAGVPGFARSYVESILFFVREGRTNFPLPVPWPWRYALGRMDAWAAIQVGGLGLCFLLTAAFFGGGGVALLAAPAARLRRNPLLAGAIAVGATYTHYTFSRADLAHLGSAIPALLLGLAAVPAALTGGEGEGTRPVAGEVDSARRVPGAWGWARRVAGAGAMLLIGGLTVAVALPAQPFYRRLAGAPLVPYRVAGEELLLRPRIAGLLGWAERESAARIPAGAPILMAPNLPGLYPALGRRSPVWDVYPIWPAAGRLDDRMLEELRRHRVEWAILQDAAVDGRAENEMRSTHPETWRYLEANFQPVSVLDPAQPRRAALLARHDAVASPAKGPDPAPGKGPGAEPKLLPQKHLAALSH